MAALFPWAERRGRQADSPLVARLRSRRHHKRPTGIAINLAPMIDVTFLLLIFFLVTTSFERAEGLLSSQMPKDRGSRATAALPISPIVVRIEQLGDGVGDYGITLDHFEVIPGDFDELASVLLQIQEQPGFDKSTPVVIVAGDAVRWDNVVGAWNAALRAGCERIAFAEP